MKTWSAVLCLLCVAGFAADAELAGLAAKAAAGDAGAERRLREAGRESVNALREAKIEGEAAQLKAREILTDIAIDTSKFDAASAHLLHDIGRDEGRAKRYANAERLYRRAEQIYDTLKKDADLREERTQGAEWYVQRKICSRMKDKARYKRTGRMPGVNLGFARIGNAVDDSDDWE